MSEIDREINFNKIRVGELGTNCYLLSIGNEICVVDPGGDPAKIIAEIEKTKEPNVKYIFLTHGHFDHILAVDDLAIKYPKSSVLIHADDEYLYMNIKKQESFTKTFLHQLSSRVTLISDGSRFFFGEKNITTMHLPGHTKGSVGYLIDDVLFSGDTIFYHNYGRIDLFWSDPGSVKDSISRVLSLPEETKILPGHGRETTVKEEALFKGVGGGKYL